jgi:N-acetylglucosaminyldiphosphoundecaprenol N-acetyl-beta-D-mannosaminyltransferase
VSGLYINGGKRALDLACATLVAVPFLLLNLLAMLAPGVRLVVKQRIGLGGRPYVEYRLRCPPTAVGRVLERIGFHRTPAIWNILRGDMSFVGPRALKADEPLPPEGLAHPRFTVRPGLVSPWWLRVRSNMTFDKEFDVDADYATHVSFRHDAGIVLRAALAFAYGKDEAEGDGPLQLLGVRIANLTTSAAIDRIVQTVAEGRQARISFVNADSLNKAFKDRAFRATLNGSDLVLADGIGIKLGARLTEQHIRENVNGTDLFPRLCERMAAQGLRLYLLGAKPDVAELVGDWVALHHPGVQVAGTRNGYFQDADVPAICAAIREARTDVLLVALGAPRQEQWIAAHAAESGARVAIGVGGLFDFYSGKIPRAPVWMREVGIEWVYRLLQEPRRMMKRYLLGNALFVVRVLRYGRCAGPRRKGEEDRPA